MDDPSATLLYKFTRALSPPARPDVAALENVRAAYVQSTAPHSPPGSQISANFNANDAKAHVQYAQGTQ
eukprot:1137257-Pelagomonas_calceolata.AAC.3